MVSSRCVGLSVLLRAGALFRQVTFLVRVSQVRLLPARVPAHRACKAGVLQSGEAADQVRSRAA